MKTETQIHKYPCIKCSEDPDVTIEGGILFHGWGDRLKPVEIDGYDERGVTHFDLEYANTIKETTHFCWKCFQKTQWKSHRCPKCNGDMNQSFEFHSINQVLFNSDREQIDGTVPTVFEKRVVGLYCSRKGCDGFIRTKYTKWC